MNIGIYDIHKKFMEIDNNINMQSRMYRDSRKKIDEIEDNYKEEINSATGEYHQGMNEILSKKLEAYNWLIDRVYDIFENAQKMYTYLEQNYSINQATKKRAAEAANSILFQYTENEVDNLNDLKDKYSQLEAKIKKLMDIKYNNYKTSNPQDNVLSLTYDVSYLYYYLERYNNEFSYYLQALYDKELRKTKEVAADFEAKKIDEAGDRAHEIVVQYNNDIDTLNEKMRNLIENDFNINYFKTAEYIYNEEYKENEHVILPFGSYCYYIGDLTKTAEPYKLITSKYADYIRNDYVQLKGFFDTKDPNSFIIHNVLNREKCLETIESFIFYKLKKIPAGNARLDVCCSSNNMDGLKTFNRFCKEYPELTSKNILTKKEDVKRILDNYVQDMNDIIQNKLLNYDDIEEFNSKNVHNKIPYRTLLLVDYPSSFDDEMYNNVKLLLSQGYKAGIQVIIVTNKNDRQTSENDKMDKLYLDTLHYDFTFEDMGTWWRNRKCYSIATVCYLNKTDYTSFKLDFDSKYDQVKDKVLKIEDIAKREYYTLDTIDKLSIPIGLNENGIVQNLEFGDTVANGTSHYGLLVGPTGSGKSSLLQTIIMSSIMNYSPEELELYLLDFKEGIEFKIYENYNIPNIKCLSLDAMQEYGESILKKLWEILLERNEKFIEASKDGVEIKSIRDYRKAGYTMPRILVIMDEFQVLYDIDANKKVANRASVLTSNFISKARVYGIHFLFASQTLKKIYETTSLSKGTLSEMHVRIGLQCPEQELESLFGVDNARKCKGKNNFKLGTGIYLENDIVSEPVGMRVAYIDSKEQNDILAKIDEKYNGKKENPVIDTTLVLDKLPTLEEMDALADEIESEEEKEEVEPSKNELEKVEETEKEEQKENKNSNVATVFKANKEYILDLSALKVNEKGKQEFLIGEPISIDSPVSILLSKKRKSNLLVVGENQEQLDNIVKVWIKSALHLGAGKVYLFDGSAMIDEDNLLDKEDLDNVEVIDNVFKVISTINEIYDIYTVRRMNMINGVKKDEDKEKIHIIISNYQWIEPIERIFEGKSISEFEITEEKNSSIDEFTKEMEEFMNNLGNVVDTSNISVKEKLRILIESGYLCGIQVVMSCNEIALLKKPSKSDLEPFTNRILLHTVDLFEARHIIDTDISMDGIDESIALFSDGIKGPRLFKPYKLKE